MGGKVRGEAGRVGDRGMRGSGKGKMEKLRERERGRERRAED